MLLSSSLLSSIDLEEGEAGLFLSLQREMLNISEEWNKP